MGTWRPLAVFLRWLLRYRLGRGEGLAVQSDAVDILLVRLLLLLVELTDQFLGTVLLVAVIALAIRQLWIVVLE